MRTLAAPAIYTAGLCALMLCDLVISSSLGIEDVAYWSRIRASTGMLTILCLLGLEQYLIRFPDQASDIKRILMIQVPILAGICAVLISTVDFLHPWYLVVLIGITVSVSAAMSQFYRGKMMLVASQISQQSWKIFLLAGVILYAVNHNIASFSQLIGLSVGAAAVALWSTKVLCKRYFEVGEQVSNGRSPGRSLLGIYSTSLKLAAISSFTALSLYGEQIIINAIEEDFFAAQYFSHVTYFLFASSFLFGYLGFVLVPWARSNIDAFVKVYTEYFFRYVIISLLFISFMQLAALFFWSVLSPSVGGVDFILFAIFFVSSFFRLIYTYPSSYMAAFGSEDAYNTMIVLQIFALIAGLSLFISLWFFGSVPAVYAVAAGSSFNWVLRTVFSLVVIRPFLHERALSEMAG